MESSEVHFCSLQSLKCRLQIFERRCSVWSDPHRQAAGVVVPTAAGRLRRFTGSHKSRVRKGAGGSPGPSLLHTLCFCGIISSQSPRCTLQGRGRMLFQSKIKDSMLKKKKKYIYMDLTGCFLGCLPALTAYDFI